MERRIALQTLAVATGGLLALPAWANAWTPRSVQTAHALLNPTQAGVLTEMIDTLIPASDSPGAKALGVPDFVQKMLADCYEPAVQQNVQAGLVALDAMATDSFGKAFVACDTTQRLAVLKQLEQAPEAGRKDFYGVIKNLTIQGFTTSEYVLTKHLNYIMIPGHYYGCVPVSATGK